MIYRGGYAKPKFTDILICQLIFLPINVIKYVIWYIKWTWKFNICKKEYGEKEKFYFIRKNMKIKEHAFEVNFLKINTPHFVRKFIINIINYSFYSNLPMCKKKNFLNANYGSIITIR